VNAPAETVRRKFDGLALDLIQLHGDEPPELLAELGDRPVMRAFRIGREGLRPVLDYLGRCHQLRCMPSLVLLDSCSSTAYGGTGQTGDWDVVADYPRQADVPPMVLAGGLNPDNVAEAISAVRPWAIDVASGVETEPGKKSSERVKAFVSQARRALQQLRGGK
jgi:phosphoribosylanthranilate isomerase